MSDAISTQPERSVEAPAPFALRRDAPLVPASSIAGRALTTVVAIMTFLACFTVGGTMLIINASDGWHTEVSSEVTMQVKPAAGVDTEATVQKAAAVARSIPGVGDVKVYSKLDSEKMLEPWLGSGLGLDDLPIPRLIVLAMAPHQNIDISALENALATNGLNASVTDQRKWLSRIDAITGAITMIAIGLCMLMIAALTLAIGFATRGAMAGSKDVIEVLHFVGAADNFISLQFQRHFLVLGLRGALLGGGAAALFFIVSSAVLRQWLTTQSGQDVSLVFGAFDLDVRGFLAIAATALALAFLTGGVSRWVVYDHLRRLA